ncbi:MAG: CHASE2 domain-containing protein [Duncaniella sp.]|nr:CHASE2 domain-containing protein [Duncaniella sp.]
MKFQRKLPPVIFLKALGMTALALFLSMVMMQPFTVSTSTLLSPHERKDFKITDFYNIVADSRDVRQLDDDIVIVNIDNSDREEIAMMLDRLMSFQPKAVGLDVTFDERRDSIVDEYLEAVADNFPNLIEAITVAPDEKESGKFDISEHSFYIDSTKFDRVGVVNLPKKFDGGVVRQFIVGTQLLDGDTLYSLPVKIAMLVAPDKVDLLRARSATLETINYPSRIYRSVEAADIDSFAGLIEDRIVLIGAMNDLGDKHLTPLGSPMPGVEIHARALSTILSGDYIKVVPQWLNIFAAALVCYLFLLLNLALKVTFKGLILRLLQVMLLYLILVFSYSVFINHNVLVDFSFTLLMVTFGLFAFDIWMGGQALYNFLRDKIRKHNSK